MNKPHYLDPLLRPASIAVVGASEREGSVGRRTVENLLTGKYEGRLYTVNPGYSTVLGVPCFARLEDLPETVEHVVLTVGDTRIEAAKAEWSEQRFPTVPDDHDPWVPLPT